MKASYFNHGYALIIGVGSDLPVTVSDARGIANVLTDPCRGAYPPEQVILLTEDGATRQGILTALDSLANQIAQDTSATVFIYFSGHGGSPMASPIIDYFLVPYGFSFDRLSETAISGKEFTKRIQSITAKKMLVMMDCCHAGGMYGEKGLLDFIPKPVPPDLSAVMQAGCGRVVVASSRETEPSYTGSPYSIFTGCLLEALEGKSSTSQDGYTRLLDVLAYLFKHVPASTEGKQHPFINNITGLSENYAICRMTTTKSPSNISPRPMPLQAQFLRDNQERILLKRDGIMPVYKYVCGLIERLQISLVTETDPAIRYRLESQLREKFLERDQYVHEIEDAEARILVLEQQLHTKLS